MQKNQMMILVVLLVVVVVAIVAVLLLSGGGGGDGVLVGGDDLAYAISQGKPVECDISGDLSKIVAASGQGSSMPAGASGTVSGVMKMENPKMAMKMTMTMNVEGISLNIDIDARSDGKNAYMKMSGMPMMPDEWVVADTSNMMGMPSDPSQIAASLEQMPEGMTLTCRLVGDIPDSEFTLPQGVTARDMSGGF